MGFFETKNEQNFRQMGQLLTKISIFGENFHFFFEKNLSSFVEREQPER